MGEFFKTTIEEELVPFATHPPQVNLCDLPEKMQIHRIFRSLEQALDGPKFQKTDKIDRLPDIERAVKKYHYRNNRSSSVQ